MGLKLCKQFTNTNTKKTKILKANTTYILPRSNTTLPESNNTYILPRSNTTYSHTTISPKTNFSNIYSDTIEDFFLKDRFTNI